MRIENLGILHSSRTVWVPIFTAECLSVLAKTLLLFVYCLRLFLSTQSCFLWIKGLFSIMSYTCNSIQTSNQTLLKLQALSEMHFWTLFSEGKEQTLELNEARIYGCKRCLLHFRMTSLIASISLVASSLISEATALISTCSKGILR